MGKRVFSGVASPRPCLEFSMPRLGLELSASALPCLASVKDMCLDSPLSRPICLDNCLEPITGVNQETACRTLTIHTTRCKQ